MNRGLLLVPLLGLLGMVFAGCVEPEVPVEEVEQALDECVNEQLCGSDAIVDEAGRDLRTQLTATDSLPAPEWVVGDVFEQHLFYGSADTQGEHIVTMVVDTAGGCYQFGTTSQVAARNEAVFDLPILGCLQKTNLGTTGFQDDWSWMYSFPLEDGKTWEGSVEIFNWNDNGFYSYDFTLTAAFAEAIDVNGMGNFPGFEITGTTADGETFLAYNYVPVVGWFSHFWMYDLATEAADDVVFHAMSMGRSTGFSGTYYIDTTETAFESFYMPPISQLEGETPEVTFNVPAEATYLKGIIVPIACVGASKVVLNTPGNQQKQYDHQATDAQFCAELLQGFFGGGGDGDAPDPRMYTVHWYDEAAEAGEWRIAHAGGGALVGYYVWLEAVTEVAYELTTGNATA